MSRIGNQPITIPEGVAVRIDGERVVVSGPKGALEQKVRPEIKVAVERGQILVARKGEDRFSKSLHGLSRSLIANAVKGVKEGYQRALKLVGTGYRVELKDKRLVLSVGFSHPVMIEPIEGINFEVKGNDTIMVLGIDKALVGQTAAKIRSIRPPEPYKGKGIRYEDERVKKKPGKAGKLGVTGLGKEA